MQSKFTNQSPGADSAQPRVVRESLSFPQAISDRIERRARWLLGVAVFVNLIAFNGIWRPGNDSAVYREIARNLVTGAGYTYHGEPERLSFPGLPYILAGIQLLFGPSPVPVLVFVMGCALLAMFLTYRLMLLDYPRSTAVIVTFLTGISATFGVLAIEVLTDMPFLVGVLLVMYGYRRIVSRSDPGRWRAGVPLVLVGLCASLLLRPTALLLIAALAIAIVVDLRSHWRAMLAAAFGLGLLLLMWITIDPRAGTPILGSYDGWWGSMLATLKDHQRFLSFARSTIDVEAPGAIFGQRMAPVSSTLLLLTVVFGVLMVAREHLLGALIVIMLLVLGVLAKSTPRYFLMVMPILMLGATRIAIGLVRHAPGPRQRLVFLVVMAVVVIPNLGYSVRTWKQQFRAAFAADGVHDRGLAYTGAMATLIREHVPKDGKVLSLNAPVLSFLSERVVVLPDANLSLPQSKEWAVRASEQGVTHVILPLDHGPLENESPATAYSGGMSWDGQKLGAARGYSLWALPHAQPSKLDSH